MKYKIISAVLVLALASMACGFSIDLPEPAKAGPDVTDQISVPFPESQPAKLNIRFGAGNLNLSPGDGENLVEGTATYNLADLKPEITMEDSSVVIGQGDYKFNNVVTMNNIKNDWELQLGETEMDLIIEAGAYDGSMELGGLSLLSLSVKDGASNAEVSFDSPNQAEMSMLRYETGASSVTMTGLANANFSNMIFRSGAGRYELDFSGDLRRDATISINSGLSNFTLRIPEGVHATVNVGGGLNNVSTSSTWSQSGNTYTQDGEGFELTFIIDMGAGNLTITD